MVGVGVGVRVAVGSVPVMVGVRVGVAVIVIVPVGVWVSDGVGVSVISWLATMGRYALVCMEARDEYSTRTKQAGEQDFQQQRNMVG